MPPGKERRGCDRRLCRRLSHSSLIRGLRFGAPGRTHLRQERSGVRGGAAGRRRRALADRATEHDNAVRTFAKLFQPRLELHPRIFMLRLPPKVKRQRSGIERSPRREWPRHRKFVRSHGCCVPGCTHGPSDFAHVKSRGAGGGDETGVSLCREHHTEQHAIGIETFQRRYGIDLWDLAAAFVRASPDRAMKEAIRLAEAQEP